MAENCISVFFERFNFMRYFGCKVYHFPPEKHVIIKNPGYLNPSVLEVNLDVPLRAETVVQKQTVLLKSPEMFIICVKQNFC